MFERLFLILYVFIGRSDDALSVIRQIENLINSEIHHAVENVKEQNRKATHELLVNICLRNGDVLDNLYPEIRKIEAIKALRREIGIQTADLKACKEAVEDSRVLAKAQDRHQGWVLN